SKAARIPWPKRRILEYANLKSGPSEVVWHAAERTRPRGPKSRPHYTGEKPVQQTQSLGPMLLAVIVTDRDCWAQSDGGVPGEGWPSGRRGCRRESTQLCPQRGCRPLCN